MEKYCPKETNGWDCIDQRVWLIDEIQRLKKAQSIEQINEKIQGEIANSITSLNGTCLLGANTEGFLELIGEDSSLHTTGRAIAHSLAFEDIWNYLPGDQNDKLFAFDVDLAKDIGERLYEAQGQLTNAWNVRQVDNFDDPYHPERLELLASLDGRPAESEWTRLLEASAQSSQDIKRRIATTFPDAEKTDLPFVYAISSLLSARAIHDLAQIGRFDGFEGRKNAYIRSIRELWDAIECVDSWRPSEWVKSAISQKYRCYSDGQAVYGKINLLREKIEYYRGIYSEEVGVDLHKRPESGPSPYQQYSKAAQEKFQQNAGRTALAGLHPNTQRAA